jgi:hypothetical protein
VPGYHQGEVPSLEAVTPKYDGVIGGPVEVGWHGILALASQRTLWAGNSLEEVMATDAADLSNHYYWPWYDQVSAGYKNWVLVSNPSSNDGVYYRVKIAGSLHASTNGQPEQGYLAPDQSITPQFAGTIGGPVEVEACQDNFTGPSGSCVTPADVISSQRVLINGDTAFNEVPGIPATSLDNDYVWSWYDETSPGAQDWILIANPPDGPAGGLYYEIWVGGNKVCDDGVALGSTGCSLNIDTVPVPAGAIAPSSYITPRFNLQDGPVEVKTFSNAAHTLTADSIATQRVTWGPSFEEVPGQPVSDIARDYHWTWYDQQSLGMTNWVVVAHPPTTGPFYSSEFSILIGGVAQDLDSVTPGLQGTAFVYPGDVKSFTFPGAIGGPVEVVSDNFVIATQRVLYNGFLNEVPGNILQP